MPARTDWSPPTGCWTPAGPCSCSRRSRTWVARSGATASCTPTSCTTRSARSTRWRRPRRRSRPSTSSTDSVAPRPRVLGHPRPDGSWAVLHRDLRIGRPARRAVRRRRPGVDTCEWDRIGGHLVDALLAPFPPIGAGTAALARLRSVGGLDFVRTLLSPASELGRAVRRREPAAAAGGQRRPRRHPARRGRLGADGAAAVHAQPDGRLPGARRRAVVTQALASRVRAKGGTIRCSAPVVRILVDRGRATGVTTADGQRYAAGRAVIADVAAPHLYGGLVPDEGCRGPSGRCAASSSTSTVKVDWARPWTGRSPGRCRHLTPRDRPRRRLGRADDRGAQPGLGGRDPGRAVPPHRSR